jgi:hypothetical protein
VSEGSGVREADHDHHRGTPHSAKQTNSPLFRGQGRPQTGIPWSASAHPPDATVAAQTAPRKQEPAVPSCVTANRELELTKQQLLMSNRRHLEAPLVMLIEEAVRPVVTEKDCELVSKAVAEMMVYADLAETSESLVDVLARRLPVLERIAAHWQSMAKVNFDVCPTRGFSHDITCLSLSLGSAAESPQHKIIRKRLGQVFLSCPVNCHQEAHGQCLSLICCVQASSRNVHG